MEIAVISDIHGNLIAFKEVLKSIGNKKIFCCGDLVGYYPFANEVIEIVKKRKIISVLGNHDYAVVTGDTSWFNPIAAFAIEWTRKRIKKENLEFLRNLPLVYKNDFYMVHGSPRNKLEEYVFPDYSDELLKYFLKLANREILILGHTHVPFVKKFDSEIVFNPGSVGQPRDFDPRASYAILDIEKREVEIIRVDYDIDAVADAVEREGLPSRLGQRLYFGR